MDKNTEIEKPRISRLAIVSILSTLVGLITLFWGIGIIFIFIGLILGIISSILIRQNKPDISGERYARASIVIGGIMCVLFLLPIHFTMSTSIQSKVTRVTNNEKNIGDALEKYYNDHKYYPPPDYDEKRNPVIPKILTTPFAYILSLPHDPFKNKGTGLYGYSCDSLKGWIITSYGPDEANGNLYSPGGTKMDYKNAWSDEKLGFVLANSRYTYDPTNGTVSAGDIWRRGP